MNNNIKNISEYKKIEVVDFSDYESGKSCNGGNYAFSTIFRRVNDNMFEITYSTSADFEYCPVCGAFHEYDEERCGNTKTISTEELKERISNIEEDEEYRVYFS